MITSEVRYRATKAHLDRFEQAAADIEARLGNARNWNSWNSTPWAPRPTTCAPS